MDNIYIIDETDTQKQLVAIRVEDFILISNFFTTITTSLSFPSHKYGNATHDL